MVECYANNTFPYHHTYKQQHKINTLGTAVDNVFIFLYLIYYFVGVAWFHEYDGKYDIL